MTERGLPIVDGAPACPFVAFEDERDERSSSPDHRHRCYAEVRPAPRALAHQEAYCLSSAFPVCPTFQEWAKREAARARAAQERADAASGGGGWRGAGDPAVDAAAGPPSDSRQGDADRALEWTEDPSGALPPRRNPPRDWAAPPPWAGGPVGSAPPRGRTPGGEADAPDVPAEGRGLAGSSADLIAAETAAQSAAESRSDEAPTAHAPADQSSRSQAPDDELAALVRRRQDPLEPVDDRDYSPVSRTGPRPAVSSTRDRELEREREREREAALVGPSWERPRRFEAYPTIRARTSMPALPRLGVMAAALAIAALALFFLPGLLGIGRPTTSGPGTVGSGSPGATTPNASESVEPTIPPAPTPQTYIIKSGDTLSKIAKAFGITLEELLAANKATITNPNKIAIGDEIIIPAPLPDEFTDPGASTEPSAAP